MRKSIDESVVSEPACAAPWFASGNRGWSMPQRPVQRITYDASSFHSRFRSLEVRRYAACSATRETCPEPCASHRASTYCSATRTSRIRQQWRSVTQQNCSASASEFRGASGYLVPWHTPWAGRGCARGLKGKRAPSGRKGGTGGQEKWRAGGQEAGGQEGKKGKGAKGDREGAGGPR